MTKDIINAAISSGLGDLGDKNNFIFFQPGTEGLNRFAAALFEMAARTALEECPSLDGQLCAEAIRALKETP